MTPCKIVLVDDHSLFRNGLRGLLERNGDCRVVGEAGSGEEFLSMLPGLEADVVFMDFSMPGHRRCANHRTGPGPAARTALHHSFDVR